MYQFEFGPIFEYTPVLLEGVWTTTALTFVGAVFGVSLGTLCAWAKSFGPMWARGVVTVYVEAIRNTPFLIQLFVVFFGLPSVGLRLSPLQSAMLAMIVNLGAYSTEIIRAGIAATPRGQIEAAQSLALSNLQIFWRVILNPAFRRIWPALTSQITLVMLGSAACSQISVEDLTYAANFIQSRNFRAFEAFLVATFTYLVMAYLLQYVLQHFGRLVLYRLK